MVQLVWRAPLEWKGLLEPLVSLAMLERPAKLEPPDQKVRQGAKAQRVNKERLA